MAGNTRGRLKEKFEGIHRNIDWTLKHLQESLILIKDHKPELSEAVKALHEGIKQLDDLAMQIYSRL